MKKVEDISPDKLQKNSYVKIRDKSEIEPVLKKLYSLGWRWAVSSQTQGIQKVATYFTMGEKCIFLRAGHNELQHGSLKHIRDYEEIDIDILLEDSKEKYKGIVVGATVRLTREIKEHFMKTQRAFSDLDFKVLYSNYGHQEIRVDESIFPDRETKLLCTSRFNGWMTTGRNIIQIFEAVEEATETQTEETKDISIWNCKCIICGCDACELALNTKCSNPECQNG